MNINCSKPSITNVWELKNGKQSNNIAHKLIGVRTYAGLHIKPRFCRKLQSTIIDR